MRTIDLSDAESARPDRRLGTFGLWTAVALVYAAILHAQIDVPLAPAVITAAVYFYTLAVLMIPVRKCIARLVGQSRPFWRQLRVHAGLAVATIIVWQGTHVLFHRLVIGADFWSLVYADSGMFQLSSTVAIYGAAIGLTLASLMLARDRERTARQHQLEVAARDAELVVLKAQFQPHFVLNALNSLLALIDSNPALARTMVVRLADLMNGVFDRVHLDLVPLERELDLIRAYLDVERIRLGPRLSVTFDVDDAARGVLVPPFLLQPVVENAVKHGVAPFGGPGHVEVSALVVERILRIVVRDSAHRTGRAPSPAAGTGRGLQITRRRLDGAYGERYYFAFVAEAGGASVEIHLPVEQRDAA